MNSFLERTLTVRQLFLWIGVSASLAIALYVAAFITHEWNLKMRSVGYRDSPYYATVPSHCRISAAVAGDTGSRAWASTWKDRLLLSPASSSYSLPESERKLGFGLQGLPCMGYSFLMVLHGDDFKKIDKYLDEKGDVVAIVTTEVVKPYRIPTPQSIWGSLPTWSEFDNPPLNDASLFAVSDKEAR